MNKLLEIALSQYGIKEIKGSQHNPDVLKYSQETGLNWVKDDETPWCSLFVNWCAMKAGLQRSGKANARSWLEVGDHINEPKPGDIVVFWRGDKNSWTGHVAIFVNKVGSNIYALGGNQNDMVNISAYPDYKVLGYRRLNSL